MTDEFGSETGLFEADEERLEEILDRLEMEEGGGHESPLSEQWEAPQFQEVADAVRRGLWSLAIRLAIQRGVHDESRLTDMLFNARHPERRGQRLQPHEQQLTREWLDIRNHLVRPALRAVSAGKAPVAPTAPSKPAWVRTLVPLLNRYRGDIPLDFLLGWIAVESGGRIESTTSINERGYFQLHPGESKTLGLDHDRLSWDIDYSVQGGIQLVRSDAKRAQALGFKYGSDLFWHIVKLLHWLPAGVSVIVQDMRQRTVQPITWEEFKEYVISNRSRLVALIKKRTGGRWGPKWDPEYGIAVVDRMFESGRQLVAGLANP